MLRAFQASDRIRAAPEIHFVARKSAMNSLSNMINGGRGFGECIDRGDGSSIASRA